MMFTTLLIWSALTLGALAAPAAKVLYPRQLSTLAAALLRTQHITQVKQQQSNFNRPDAKRVQVKLGPFELRPADVKPRFGLLSSASMDPGGTGFIRRMPADFPRDITILKSATSLQFEDGRPANMNEGVYNHHFMIDNLSRIPPTIFGCNGVSTGWPTPGAVVAARAEDQADLSYTSADGKLNSGVYMGKDDFVALWVDLVNYKNSTQTVYATLELDYLEGKGDNTMASTVQAMFLGQCDSIIPGTGFQIHAPAGQPKFSLYGGNVSILKDGYLLNMAGHMHDGGDRLQMMLNGKLICESKAIYGNSTAGHNHGHDSGSGFQTIAHMSQCDGPFEVSKGDNITVTAHYDTIAHPSRPQTGGTMAEQMAIFAGIFAAKNK